MINKIILVVEDEDAIQTLLTDLLVEEGYKVIVDGEVSKVRQLFEEVQFDLIILDYSLLDGTGNDVLDLLTKLKLSIPTIGLSATTDKFKPHPQLIKLVAKPFDINELVSLVEAHFSENS